jgi:magnesium transporter
MSVMTPINYNNGKKLTGFEFSFFLTDDAIVTITQQPTDLLQQEFREEDRVANVSLERTPQLLAYRFLERLYDTSYKNIELISKAINMIDDQILDVRSSSIIRNISILQRNIIFFMTTLESALPNFQELEHKNVNFGRLAMDEYWGDLVDTIKQQHDLLDDYDRILSKLAKAHENIVGYHTNHVIHVLTIISVIFLPLNLIAGIYGMNFSFIPTAEHPIGFFLALLTMIFVSLVMILFFKYKKWI